MPLAGHKDNHSGIMNNDQFDEYTKLMKIRKGQEWNKTEGIKLNDNELNSIVKSNPLSKCNREFSETIPIKPLKKLHLINLLALKRLLKKL